MIDRLPTRMNLTRKGVNIQDNLYPLCLKVEETIQHLLITCEVAQKVWDYCDIWLGVSFVRHNDVVHHFGNCYIIGLGRKGNMMWKGMWVAIVYEIWKQRNRIVFYNGRVDVQEIFTLAQLNAWTWAKFKWHRMDKSYSD